MCGEILLTDLSLRLLKVSRFSCWSMDRRSEIKVEGPRPSISVPWIESHTQRRTACQELHCRDHIPDACLRRDLSCQQGRPRLLRPLRACALVEDYLRRVAFSSRVEHTEIGGCPESCRRPQVVGIRFVPTYQKASHCLACNYC
jgi:hypothetical protein